MYRAMGDFRIGPMAMRYSGFVQRLYNWCLQLGFEPQYMMPSRAFCSDENQGYPTILLTKQFGTFPFNHGRVGGVVATDRHGAFADHGRDLVLIQASHVGYDATTGTFGSYRRRRAGHQHHSPSCGKLCDVIDGYLDEYQFAQQNIKLGQLNDQPVIVIDNALLNAAKAHGLYLHLDRLIDGGNGSDPLQIFSTSKAFRPNSWLQGKVDGALWRGSPRPIDQNLSAEMFDFNALRRIAEHSEILQGNLVPAMAHIVTSKQPALEAACYNTQTEFDRTYRSLIQEPVYRKRNLLFISGLNVDISPEDDMPFPLTKFIPWAAFYRAIDGTSRVLEQAEVFDVLQAQAETGGEKMELDKAIETMASADAITLRLVD